jgi:hypothetical protein
VTHCFRGSGPCAWVRPADASDKQKRVKDQGRFRKRARFGSVTGHFTM